jgi:hypothetical protein
MKSTIEPTDDQVASLPHLHLDEEQRRQVLHELDNILGSRFFKSAARGSQFLKYIVEHGFDGHTEQLKERTIGVEVFQRPHDYATGDDPVVRVQAGEVRRRLEQYYQTVPEHSHVRIDLPLGSYSPTFHWLSNASSVEVPAGAIPAQQAESTSAKRGSKRWWIAGVCALLALTVVSAFLILHRAHHAQTALEQFWGPVFATQRPVIICLAAPVVYRPLDVLFQRYNRTHPGAFQTEMDKTNNPLPLDPKETIQWGDMYNYADYGVARGDTYAAVELSALFARLGKQSEVRIGANYSFEDLRNSPAVVVGAFNNKWTLYITSNLYFYFVQNGDTTIREQTKNGRVWTKHINSKGEVLDDTAIVSRLLDSKTGQFTITVAGIGGTGTQAAAEFVSNPELLAEGLRNAPPGWQTKNLEIVLQTTVTDSVPGPARVVATYTW